ncbi:MAG: iron-containing alcohol dehydrogenase [Myxococcota bacterium]
MTIHTYAFPTTIHFGPGARHRLPAVLDSAHASRPLIVTDEGVAALPLFADLHTIASSAGAEVGTFSGVVGNPIKSQVTAGVEAYRNHNADAIIALGGGAAMDVAKAVALMVHHPGDLFDYEDGKPDALPVDQPIPFMVALPTTAGTGSEVGRSSVIGVDDTKVKKIIFDPRLLPNIALADPELTLSLPPAITAATGMDALAHNVEAYLSKGFHPMADGIALEGIRLVASSLRTCVHKGDDLQARGELMIASLMGAVAFQKGLGVTHSLAHPLSTVCDLHHGLANGIMLPYAMAFNAGGVGERFAPMAIAAGIEQHDADGFIGWLKALRRDIDIPDQLGDVGVTEDHLDALVTLAVDDVCHSCNPIAVSAEDFRRMYREALGQ